MKSDRLSADFGCILACCSGQSMRTELLKLKWYAFLYVLTVARRSLHVVHNFTKVFQVMPFENKSSQNF